MDKNFKKSLILVVVGVALFAALLNLSSIFSFAAKINSRIIISKVSGKSTFNLRSNIVGKMNNTRVRRHKNTFS